MEGISEKCRGKSGDSVRKKKMENIKRGDVGKMQGKNEERVNGQIGARRRRKGWRKGREERIELNRGK